MRYFFILLICLTNILSAQEVYFRFNQAGYYPEDAKMVFIMAKEAISLNIELIDSLSGNTLFKGKLKPVTGTKWGQFQHQYLFDCSSLTIPGTYALKVGHIRSQSFTVDPLVYEAYLEDLVDFMRQQRCGYNPYFDEVCHQRDGRIFYAPANDSTFYDFSGGWHDAGDQLKYLITTSNATARLLLAYELAPEQFTDHVDHLGHPYPNGIPDVLDEAKWGLDWILKLHPKPDWLIHQIADDRDHRGFKFPHKDNADYGWGSNSYRAAYFATGTPQGLGKWKSESTGIANIAGRSAAALAIGARIWQKNGWDETFALKCQQAAIELYQMGKANEGYQQGNSYGSPYRYNEDSWADDMEWAAAALYRLTREPFYLEDAIKYAYLIKEDGWMARDSMDHYQKYPFMNVGHFALFQFVSDTVQLQLTRWYQANIEKVIKRSEGNAFQIGIPFLWCSNNLLVNFITQVLLYEKMTGDYQYHTAMQLHRDWLFGRNPWGTSMLTGIPYGKETPYDVHLPSRALLKQTPAGGLVDGPIYRTIFNTLKGLSLTEPDEFLPFQNDFVVYHDDIGDYSTNEPTMDGTADAILMMALWCAKN